MMLPLIVKVGPVPGPPRPAERTMAIDTINGRLGTIDDILTESPSPRDRILRAAAMLLAEGGREAVSTRAVSAVAGVQPPTIYRQFGDMRGLLDAVAEDGFARYLQGKFARAGTDDPVADLRAGWDAHIGFGLANPALYALMYGEPRPGARPIAAVEALKLLEGLVRRVAKTGRLRVGVDRASRLIHAAGVGVVLTLIALKDTDRDVAVSDLTREAILAAVIADSTPINEASVGAGSRLAAHAVALKALLPEASATFTPAERGLLTEWLDRLIREP
jgi:AcrR family transcriptional regulator